MARPDVLSKWAGTIQFAVISTPRSLRLTDAKDGADADRYKPWDYVEVDARGVKGATIWWAVNGRTASSVALSTFSESGGPHATYPNFRLPPDSIDRVFIKCTSISVVSAVNATNVYINVARH